MCVSLSLAIARQEGYYVPHTRAQKNNNPGNLNFGAFARSHGATRGDDKGYAVFPTVAAGWAALKALLESPSYAGLTLAQAITRFCPPSGDVRGDNDTAAYIQHVSEWTGISPSAPIAAHV